MQRSLIVMLKQPRLGRVKTRLARDIGAPAATWWFRHQTRSLLRRLEDPRWSLVLAVAPDPAVVAPDWPRHLPRLPQGPGHLGERMLRMMRAMPPGPVCLIGGDIPGIQPAHINRAFKALGSSDTVFGPAPDGGYWLIGMKQGQMARPGLLDRVRWSTEHALADSMTCLKGRRIALTDQLRDVDTAADLSGKH